MTFLAILAVIVLVALTLGVLIVDLLVVNPRCHRTIDEWAASRGYRRLEVHRQWIGRDVVRNDDGHSHDVHSRPGGRYFVLSAIADDGSNVRGRLRVEGGFQGYGANQVKELVIEA